MIGGLHFPFRKKALSRTVLAFFPAMEDQTAEVRRAAHDAGVRDPRFIRGTKDPRPDAGPHSRLVLEGERLMLAEVPAEQSVTLVQALRQVGHTAVFVLPEHVVPPVCSDPAESATSLSLRELQQGIEAAQTDLSEAVGLGHPAAPAAAWFLDNAYLIRSNLSEIRTDLPREYRKMLTDSAPAARTIRVDAARSASKSGW